MSVEIQQILSVSEGFPLDVCDTFAEYCIGGRVPGSVALVSGKHLVVHKALAQARFPVGPVNEFHEILLA